MAKAASGTKSAAIHEYMTANPEANVQQIFDGLKARGIKVSLGLVSKVKYRTGKKPAAKKAGRAMAALSMSDSIRHYIAKHSNAGPKDIQAGLKAEGIKVKLGLISAVKYSKAKKAGKKKQQMRASVVHAAARRTSTNGVTVEQLIEVKRLADSLGGADQVRNALDTLAQLQ